MNVGSWWLFVPRLASEVNGFLDREKARSTKNHKLCESRSKLYLPHTHYTRLSTQRDGAQLSPV
jgi:hypothetical protein